MVLKAYTKLANILLKQDMTPIIVSSILRMWLKTHTETVVPAKQEFTYSERKVDNRQMRKIQNANIKRVGLNLLEDQ